MSQSSPQGITSGKDNVTTSAYLSVKGESQKAYAEEKIKKLNDKELLELEHDTEVECRVDLSGNLEIFETHGNLLKEIENRGLNKLPRLNGFM